MKLVPLFLAALALAASAPPAHAAELRPGDPLPELAGELLTGEAASLPAAARGRVALLLMGFSDASRFPVEAWGARFREAFAGDSTVTFYEVPMMSGLPVRLARPFINRGMRGGTPPALHGNVMTVWNHTAAWRRRLGVDDRDLAHLVLLARDGTVAWIGAGARDLAGFDGLVARARALAARR